MKKNKKVNAKSKRNMERVSGGFGWEEVGGIASKFLGGESTPSISSTVNTTTTISGPTVNVGGFTQVNSDKPFWEK